MRLEGLGAVSPSCARPVLDAQPPTPARGPQLDQLATKYAGLAVVGLMSCADEENMRAVCKGIAGLDKVPTVRIFSGARQRNPYTKGWYRRVGRQG